MLKRLVLIRFFIELCLCEDMVEFIKWAEQFENGEYLFRGVPSACYSIEASFYRCLSETKKTPEALLEINQDLIAEARHQGHDLKNGQKLQGLELLAELQHFGTATGLIDFTYNALVALWFACWKSPSEENKNGKVVVLRRDGLEPLTKVDYNLSQKNIEFFSDRMKPVDIRCTAIGNSGHSLNQDCDRIQSY